MNKNIQRKAEYTEDVRPFFDFDGGPSISKLVISFKGEKSRMKKIKLRRILKISHKELFVDPYTGRISFNEKGLKGLNKKIYNKHFKDVLKDGIINDEIKIELTWFSGSLPVSLLRAKKIESEFVSIETSGRTGYRSIILRDWVMKYPWTIYGVYLGLIVTAATVPAVLISLLNIFT